MNPPAPSLAQIFMQFLKLGCTAFGGPVAHLGYFRETFVRRLSWISDEDYADVVALCQFLPGPASSQVGFAIGVRHGGVVGGMLAWVGFTLPSAVLMIGFALGLTALGDIRDAGWVVGLKLAAVAVVAHAVWGMAEKLCADRVRAVIAALGAAFLLAAPGALWQPVVIAAGAAAGWWIYRSAAVAAAVTAVNGGPAGASHHGAARRAGWPWLAVFALLLLGLPVVARYTDAAWLDVGEGFYRAGSLVFGGGHVVLPLLDSFTVGNGWVTQDSFLAGYGAAQAVPGPLFTFAGFLGASLGHGPTGIAGGCIALVAVFVPSWLLVLGALPYWEWLRRRQGAQAALMGANAAASLGHGPTGIAGGCIALVAVFMPSWLLVLGALPYWERLRRRQGAQAALMGANAAVVGLLLAAFIHPVWSSAVTDPRRAAFAVVAFVVLRFTPVPPWLLVALAAAAGEAVFA